jgi:nucleotide-binding universal stress UspA family protein
MEPRILVPYDFSSPADAALRWAVELHRSCGGAIKLIHLMENPLPISYGGAVPNLPPSRQEVEQRSAELQQVADRLAPDAEVEIALVSEIAAGVLEAAKAWRADLIAIGTHGRGGVSRMLLGSVADKVVRGAECPVLTMRGSA